MLALLLVRRADHEADAAGDERAKAGSGEHLERNRIVRSGEGDTQRGYGGEGALGDPWREVASFGGRHDIEGRFGPKRFPGVFSGDAPTPYVSSPAMPTADLVITSSRVVTEDGVAPAALAITDGTITALEAPGRAPDARHRLDVGNSVVMAGVVDTHVHVNEPGRTEWEGFQTATRAAAAGGVTTIVDMPLNSVPVTTTARGLRAKADAAGGTALVDFGFWGGAIPGNLRDLQPLAEAGVLGFKAFLVPSGIDEFPAVSVADLEQVMDRLAALDTVLLAHAELPGPIARAARNGGDPRRYATWLAARPPEAELEAIHLLLRLAGKTGCAVHVVHLSAARGLEPLAAARAAGTAVTVETCPHYLCFAAEDIPDGATAFKCAPPIRERDNREQLWSGLRSGDLDFVASDHSPAPPVLKCLDSGDFVAAWGGVASLELALAAVWTGGRARGATLVEVARWLAAAPARRAGLEGRKGRLAPGLDADLAIWDPEATFTVDPTRLHQRHPVTPYAGMTLWGVVRETFVRGVRVYENGRFPSPPVGRWLRR